MMAPRKFIKGFLLSLACPKKNLYGEASFILCHDSRLVKVRFPSWIPLCVSPFQLQINESTDQSITQIINNSNNHSSNRGCRPMVIDPGNHNKSSNYGRDINAGGISAREGYQRGRDISAGGISAWEG